MNKKLLALAIGAAVAMPVAALADGPTLYGKINLSLENVDDELGIDSDLSTAGTETDGWVVRDNSSRIGIKGSAETGVDGLKGIYLAEFGLAADDGSEQVSVDDPSAFSQRNIYVGLQGGFGTVLVGNLDTPTKSVQGKVDQFNDSAVDMSNLLTGELRAPNVVAYASPKIADAVTVTVALWQAEGGQVGDGERGNGLGDAVSASVVYEKDSLYLGLGMDMETPVASGLLSGLIDEAIGVDLENEIYYNDILRAVVGYTTDTVEVGFLYQTTDGVNDYDTPAPLTADISDVSEDAMVLSGAYKTGDWKFKAQYGTSEVEDVEATMMAIGADYALGKATTLNAFYANEEVDAGGTAERTLFGVGLEQRF